MNTILVWVLVTMGGYGGTQVVYSPQMSDLASCQRLLSAVMAKNDRGQCVQIAVPK